MSTAIGVGGERGVVGRHLRCVRVVPGCAPLRGARNGTRKAWEKTGEGKTGGHRENGVGERRSLGGAPASVGAREQPGSFEVCEHVAEALVVDLELLAKDGAALGLVMLVKQGHDTVSK